MWRFPDARYAHECRYRRSQETRSWGIGETKNCGGDQAVAYNGMRSVRRMRWRVQRPSSSSAMRMGRGFTCERHYRCRVLHLGSHPQLAFECSPILRPIHDQSISSSPLPQQLTKSASAARTERFVCLAETPGHAVQRLRLGPYVGALPPQRPTHEDQPALGRMIAIWRPGVSPYPNPAAYPVTSRCITVS